jgi:hypothetical protein
MEDKIGNQGGPLGNKTEDVAFGTMTVEWFSFL